jgi:hypothetical protein
MTLAVKEQHDSRVRFSAFFTLRDPLLAGAAPIAEADDPLGVVYVLVSGKTTKYRLPQ